MERLTAGKAGIILFIARQESKIKRYESFGYAQDKF